MRVFFDSSAWAKIYVKEDGSQRVLELCRKADICAISVICIPEVISSLNRRKREGLLTSRQYASAKDMIMQDIHHVAICDLTPSAVASSITFMEASPLRGMDALHLACAREWQADLFVSSDHRQLTAAREAGLKSECV